jgi:hypothetical protein
MQRQAVRRPLTGLAITTIVSARSSLRGASAATPVGPTAQRTHDLRPRLTDAIEPRPGLSDQKFAKLPPWNWNSRVYKPARSIACSFLRQAEIHATISSEQNPSFERRWCEKEGENEPALERLVVSPRPRVKFLVTAHPGESDLSRLGGFLC